MTSASDMEWWGYSTQHGWVVLDRSLPMNRPGIRDDLLFYRFHDGTTFYEVRVKWNPPLYQFAPNYLRDLSGDEAAQAEAEFQKHKSEWPAAQEKIHREREEEAKRIEAARRDEEKKRKQAEREAKKQRADAVPSA